MLPEMCDSITSPATTTHDEPTPMTALIMMIQLRQLALRDQHRVVRRGEHQHRFH